MTREDLAGWVAAYERAWRTPGTDRLRELFSADAVYSRSPYLEPERGLAQIAVMWEAERDAPDEPFALTADVVAVEADTGVVRVEVRYGDPVAQEYRDLWVVRMGEDGRATHFEEWPFWPAHGTSPTSAG